MAREVGTLRIYAAAVYALDREGAGAGYWPSSWPVECGGNRRQKSSPGRLDAAVGVAEVTTRSTGRWDVMVVHRDPGEWYVGGTMPAFSGPPPFGWVERFDPVSLEPVVRSPDLPCGEHVWCGAILAHANGSIYSVNGSYLHRLDAATLGVEAERALVDCSHNGLLAMSDGSLLTKDLRLEGQGATTVSRFEPDSLEPIGTPLVLPEGSMGRVAADVGADGVDRVYVPGTEHLFRLGLDGDELVVDDWSPRYRDEGGPFGMAWDACLSGEHVWVMDDGDVESVRHIHRTFPNGRFDQPPALSWRQPAPWDGPQRLHRIDPVSGEVMSVAPFGVPGGGIIAPPVVVPEVGVAVAWDSVNGGLAGVGTESLDVRWILDVRPSMQPVVFPDSGELVINDFSDDGVDHLVVVDVGSGELLDRVDTGSRIANGMFLTAGTDRDVYYCSTLTLARVAWV
ncbi:MAG: hypothetical protein AAGD18_00240 [Actinomycetota bacterium]